MTTQPEEEFQRVAKWQCRHTSLRSALAQTRLVQMELKTDGHKELARAAGYTVSLLEKLVKEAAKNRRPAKHR